MSRLLQVAAWATLAFFTLPTAIVALLSVSGDASFVFPPRSLSFLPYVQLLNNDVLRTAYVRSLIAAGESAAISLTVGLPAALALAQMKTRAQGPLLAFLTLGFASPLTVSAVALLIVFLQIGIFGSLFSLAVALAIVNLPFLLYAIAASVAAMDASLEAAAATLGARPVEVLLMVRLPSLAPGILTGTLLVFILGATEFMVSIVLTTVSSQTLPVAIYGSMRSGPSPMLAAAGMCYVLLAVLVVWLLTRSRGLQQFLYRRS